jgi:hypothetical protein
MSISCCASHDGHHEDSPISGAQNNQQIIRIFYSDHPHLYILAGTTPELNDGLSRLLNHMDGPTSYNSIFPYASAQCTLCRHQKRVVAVYACRYRIWHRDGFLFEGELAPALRAAYLGGEELVALRMNDAAMVSVVGEEGCCSYTLLFLEWVRSCGPSILAKGDLPMGSFLPNRLEVLVSSEIDLCAKQRDSHLGDRTPRRRVGFRHR